MIDPQAAQWLPESSTQRLADSAQGKCFTSDLSVDEFVLVRESGFAPLGLVMGSSMYHIGLQVAGWKESTELQNLTQAMYAGRELAMSRMQSEGEQAGAGGVVGVTVTEQSHVWGEHAVEFLAVGTGVHPTAPERTSALDFIVPV